jgi:Xaa-Pro dipeptidase
VSGLFNSGRAKQYMNETGLDVLIATSAVNVRYFTGYSCWLDPLFKEYMMSPGSSSEFSQRSYAVFPREGSAALITKSLMSIDAADIGIKDIRGYGDPGVDYSLLSSPATDVETRFLTLLRDTPADTTALGALGAALRHRGLTDANIGIEMEGLSAELKADIVRTLPRARLRDCTNLIRLIRAVKTPGEIAILARAAEIAEQAAYEGLARTRVGGRAKDLVAHFRSGVGAQGAAFDHFSFSVSGLGICSEPDFVFRPQDVMFIDYGCIVSSYFSDTGTTLAFAELQPEISRRHAALHSCVKAGAQAMRPATKSSSIQKAMAEVLREAGIHHSFPHGHGMGLELRDYPILVPSNGLQIGDECIAVDSDLPLEEGMVINLEAPLFMPIIGAIQVEKTFVVTAQGARELVPQDRAHPYFAAYDSGRGGPV